MGITSGVYFLLLVGASTAATIAKGTSPDPLVSELNNLPEEEKPSFISYFLAMGIVQPSKNLVLVRSVTGTVRSVAIPEGLNITDDQIQKFQDMNIPDSSSRKLVSWTKTEFDIDDNGVLNLAALNEVCNENGDCFSLPDIGSLCCPW